jgi:hypothetical protein
MWWTLVCLENQHWNNKQQIFQKKMIKYSTFYINIFMLLET